MGPFASPSERWRWFLLLFTTAALNDSAAFARARPRRLPQDPPLPPKPRGQLRLGRAPPRGALRRPVVRHEPQILPDESVIGGLSANNVENYPPREGAEPCSSCSSPRRPCWPSSWKPR
ncbi:hypothetical protein NL676_025587 [Syzygium grande]|nr:hypothetical protein NL676_025587 [Syzygium grande]